ncbi:nose resistant to fluoxetine protein 6-like [Contarinia nasturtii]|uniref:nose resistant to fluoxetine protein 6-like n=1 Tax=Contarinia nasturtii TaxID=265458 RepID=UPI0012D4589D|nr:nose resistant to fluoxetine protein 6-like [Contarinia nasturtii]
MKTILNVKLSIFFGLISSILAATTNSSVTTNFSGLLSDVLQTHLQHDLKITKLCNQQLRSIQNGLDIKEIWAIKLLDASGHVAPGFVWGNNFWLGSKKACQFINKRAPVVLSHELHKNHFKNLTYIESPFPVEYKLIWARHSSRWQVDISTFEKTMLHVGICLPQSCSDEDVNRLVDTMLNSRIFGEKYYLDENFSIVESKTIKLRDNFFGTMMVNLFLYILLLNLVLVTIGSIYMNLSLEKVIFNKPVADIDIKKANNNQIKCTNINAVLNVDSALFNQQTNKTKRTNSIIERFLSCFCIVKNSEIITTESLGTDSIEVIHGMRAIGMIWIIAGHLFFYGPSAVENLQMVLTYAEEWYVQPLFSVAIAVDTYFVISGLVLAYLFFQTEKKKKKESAIIKFVSSVVNRYLRLTPPYLVVIALTGFLSIYLRDTSQYWLIEHNDINCPKYWWRNLFYIQNMYPLDNMCMTWSWFLAADFQCFCLTSFLLVIYTKKPKVAVSIFVLLFVSASLYTGYLGYVLKYSLTLDVQYNVVDYLYTPTYTRIGAYFIGVYAGWFLSAKDRKLNIKKKFVVLGWVVGPLLLILMIFGPTKKELSPLGAVLYTGLGKTAWSLGIAWFIIACATGRGGIINRILSAKCLLPYSRMTYTAYLINPLCIMFVVMSSEAPIHLDFLSLLVNSLGFQAIVFTLSYIFMLLFENPFIRLGKLLQGK